MHLKITGTDGLAQETDEVETVGPCWIRGDDRLDCFDALVGRLGKHSRLETPILGDRGKEHTSLQTLLLKRFTTASIIFIEKLKCAFSLRRSHRHFKAAGARVELTDHREDV